MFLLQPALNVGEASLAVCFETLWICSEMSPSCSKWWLVTFHQVWVYPPLLHPRWPSILPVCLYCPASTSASWDSYPWGSSHTDLCPDLCSEQGWSEQGELSGLGMAAGGNVREFLGSSLVKQEKPRLVVRIKRAREKTKTTQTAEGQERSHSRGHRWEAAVGKGGVRRRVRVSPRWPRSCLCWPWKCGAVAGLAWRGEHSLRQSCPSFLLSVPERQHPQRILEEGSCSRHAGRNPWFLSELTGQLREKAGHLLLCPDREWWREEWTG